MARNVLNPVEGRYHVKQMVSYFRVPIKAADVATAVTFAKICTNAILVSLKVDVIQPFAGKKLKFGSTEEVNDYSEADVGTAGVKVVNIPLAKRIVPKDEELVLHMALDSKADSGEAIIVLQYVLIE